MTNPTKDTKPMEPKDNIHKYLINDEQDREHMVIAFANAGYRVKIQTDVSYSTATKYYVVVYVPKESL
jgi:hypothetical protein